VSATGAQSDVKRSAVWRGVARIVTCSIRHLPQDANPHAWTTPGGPARHPSAWATCPV